MSKFLHDDDLNSKSKKGHNCTKNILRVTSPIGMNSPFHNEQLVQVDFFSNDRDITKCPSFCRRRRAMTIPRRFLRKQPS